MTPKKHIAIIPGDGIGPEVISEALKVIQASHAAVETTHFDWSANRYLADGVTVPPDGFAMLARDFTPTQPRSAIRVGGEGVFATLKLGVHLACALPEANWIEYSFQGYEHLVEEPVAFEGGYAIAPERPGHGLALAEAARREYARPDVA